MQEGHTDDPKHRYHSKHFNQGHKSFLHISVSSILLACSICDLPATNGLDLAGLCTNVVFMGVSILLSSSLRACVSLEGDPKVGVAAIGPLCTLYVCK